MPTNVFRAQPSGHVYRYADEAMIPPSDDNPDYLVYLAWVVAGNTPDPAVPSRPAPIVAKGAQLSAALDDLGRRAAFEMALAAAKPGDRLYWNNGYRFPVPITNPKLNRILAGATPPIDPAALFAAAQKE